MATISFVDRIKIDKFLTPLATSKGYVLDFSNASLQDFIGSITGINIYEEGKYDNYGTSKANRLRSFFEKESDRIVGKVLLELVEYQKTLLITHLTWTTTNLKLINYHLRDSSQ